MAKTVLGKAAQKLVDRVEKVLLKWKELGDDLKDIAEAGREAKDEIDKMRKPPT